MAVNVSMQSHIPTYGQFGTVGADTMMKGIQNRSEEKKQKWRIESQEIMQLRDLHENARQFDITHELKRDYFDVHKEDTLDRLSMDEDQYWNHVEDMNKITLEQASMNWENVKQNEIEQKHIVSQIVPKMNEIKTKLSSLQEVYEKDYKETETYEGTEWYHLYQQFQDGTGIGTTTQDMIDNNLEQVDAQHKENIATMLKDEYGINLNELSFDFENTDAATILDKLTLSDFIESDVFAGGPGGEKFVDDYGNAGLTNQTYGVLNNITMTQIMDTEDNLTNLGDLINTGYKGQEISAQERATILMNMQDPRMSDPEYMENEYKYRSTFPSNMYYNEYEQQPYTYSR